MNNRLYLTVIALALSWYSTFAQENNQKAFSLQEAIDYAVVNNQNVVNAAYEKEIAETQVKETLSRGLPQVNLNSGLNYNFEPQKSLLPPEVFGLDPNDLPEGAELVDGELVNTFQQAYDGNIALSASQLIFDGSFFVGLQASKTFKELSSKDHIKTQIDVAEAVSKAYYNVLVNEERYDLLIVNLGRIDSLLTDTQALYENGFVEKIDVNRAKVQRNNLKVQVDNTLQLLDLSRDLLKFQMGLRISDAIVLTDKLEEVDFAVVEKQDFSYNERIEYSQLQTNLALVNLDMKNNKVQRLPAVYANFNYGYNTQTGESSKLFDNDRWLSFGTLGVTVGVPIFDGFLKRSRIQKNQIQAKQIEQSFDLLENSIDLEINQAKINLTSAIENMVAQKENTELAEEIYNVAKIKYDEGVGSSLEVTNADADYKEAQTNYYNSLYDALVAKVELQKAYGTLYN